MLLGRKGFQGVKENDKNLAGKDNKETGLKNTEDGEITRIKQRRIR